VAKYLEVAAELRAAISGGRYAVGELIPHEPVLAEQYGVSQDTVRRAVAELRRDGLLKPIRRKGTVVRRPPVRVALSRYQHGGPELGPWETACADSGVAGETKVKSVTRTAVDEHLAGLLGIETGAEAVCRRRWHYAEGDLAMISELWLNPALADDTPLSANAKIVGGIYPAWIRLGWRPVALSESITVREATRDEARLMQLPTGAQVLSIERVTRAAEDTVLDVQRAVASTEWVKLVYEDVPIPSNRGGA
jgi:GntR family transcriptional regulator